MVAAAAEELGMKQRFGIFDGRGGKVSLNGIFFFRFANRFSIFNLLFPLDYGFGIGGKFGRND